MAANVPIVGEKHSAPKSHSCMRGHFEVGKEKEGKVWKASETTSHCTVVTRILYT